MQAVFEIFNHGLSLKLTGILLGVVLIAAHAVALVKADALRRWLPAFPRNKQIGIGILAVDLVWAWIFVSKMDLGEFYTIRSFLLILLPIAFFLVITFVDEFLSVRALGTFALLVACPVLGAPFLEEPITRLLLPILAYVWIIAGLFWVGMPYLLRDQIGWIVAQPGRLKVACFAGIGYGALVLACAFLFY